MDEKKAKICDEILLDYRKSDMEDVKDEGNAAGDENTKNEEKDFLLWGGKTPTIIFL